VCGEAAGDPTVAAALVGLGIDELSMTRVAIPEARRILEERLGTDLEDRRT
jgi:phosphoenolpyruvate-protein kinase (PTS system EI component)